MEIERALGELQGEDETVRMTAIRWLRVIGGVDAVRALLGELADPSEEVRKQAVLALGELKAGEAVPLLCERLAGDLPADERACCAMALGSMRDARALDPLRQALDDPSEWVASQACEALGALRDPRAIETLLEALDHPVEPVRETAQSCLVELKIDDARVTGTLERAVRQAEQRGEYLRAASLWESLAALKGEARSPAATGEAEHRALGNALAHLTNEDPQVRWRATRELRGIGGARAVEALIGAMSDPSERVRTGAALALGGLEAREAVPVLIERLRSDESGHVRAMCAAFLHYFAGEAAVVPLIRALEDPNRMVVGGASIGLGFLGDARAVPGLLRLLVNPEWNLRFNVCLSLVRLRTADPRLVAALEQLAREPDAEEHDLLTRELDLSSSGTEGSEREEGEPGLTVGEVLERARSLSRQSWS